MYRSGSRSSVPSSHRPKDSGDGGSRMTRSSGSSAGSVRRPSSPPSCSSSSSSSSRPPARRHRSPSGHRSRRASPSPPPRGRRCSPSPSRGRRTSRSPSWTRRGSPPSPPRSRRLYPPGPSGFRGSSRGESRADFARDGRGDYPDDSSSRRRSPGLCSESLEQSLRITVGNDHFCVSTTERRRLSDHLGSPVDNLEDMDRDDLTDDSVFIRNSQCSRGLQRYISREEGSLSPLGQLDEDYPTRETFHHRSEYSSHGSCHDELLWRTEQDRDKLRGSYSIRSEERSRESKRPRYDDTEKIPSMGGDHPSFTSGTRNYRQHRRSPSPRFLDPEFRELDLARRKREEEERSRSLSQELVEVDNGGTSCSIPGLSGVLTTSESGYALHRPNEASAMPKKSILKKRIEVDMKPSVQPESFSSSASSSQNCPLYSDHSSLPLSGAIADFASDIENKGNTVETALKEPQSNLYQWGSFPERPKDNNPLREKFESFLCRKEKLHSKAEGFERHTDFLLPHERASQDGSGFSRILSVLADSTSAQEKRRCSFPDIEDEEKFLYGDEEEDLKAESPPKCLGDSENEVMRQKGSPLTSSAPATQLESLEETNPEYAKIHDLLKTIGLDIGVEEISKLEARTQERLHGKKPSSRSSADRRSCVDQRFSADHHSSVDQRFSTDRCSSVDPYFSVDGHASDLHRLESREIHHSSTHPPEVSHPNPASPVDPYLLTKNSPPFLKSDHPMSHISGSEVVGSGFQPSVAVRCRLPSVPSTPIRLPRPASLSSFLMPRASQFATARIPPNYQRSAIPPASFEAYRHYMAYAASRWPMYPASQPSNHHPPETHKSLSAIKKITHSRPNLRVIYTGNRRRKQKTSVQGSTPAAQAPAQVSIPPLMKCNPEKSNPEKTSDEKNRASQKQKVIEEREKLKSDQEARQKKMLYLKTELERLQKQQGEMLRKKRREKDGHKDPLLVEVSRLQENIMKDIADLNQEAEEAEKKQSELDKVAQILGINILDKSLKSSNDNKESTEKPGDEEKSKSPEKVLSLSNASSNSQERKDDLVGGTEVLPGKGSNQGTVVIEEREKLKSDQEARQKKMLYLKTELERLQKQQGEMLRKKRREKDGHKDPLLVEVSRLQENIMKDIADLNQEAEEAEKKQSELDKVAQILGINILDKSLKSSNDNKESTEKPGDEEKSKSPEKVLSLSNASSNSQESTVNSEKSHIKSPTPAESPQPSAKQSDEPVATYEYYDAGNHWCKDCNTICGTVFDFFFTHMYKKKHTQTLDSYNRPWASKTQSEAKQDAIKRTDKITVPAKGSEFLIPITGFYCQLCEEFLGDSISGEQHVKGHQHNEKYKKYVEENPLYEERRNLDHQTGFAVVLETERRRQSELKRKLSEKTKEEKKEKKAKVVKEAKEDDKVSVELENQFSEGENSPEKAENKRSASIKLQEEVKKESPISSLGKFNWKKPEKEEKSSVVAPSNPKEEIVESSKDKEDSKAEAGKAKPIKIKLSGKTVVAPASPWVPVVKTSTQTKIRPNLPIPSTVLRKPCSATVSKPAPLNTFLSIKSSGTPAKPLPVVKESSAGPLLPPDIISKAIGGEEVILRGSPEENVALAEKNEPSQIPGQILAPLPPPPPPPPPPPLPVIHHSTASSSASVNLAPIKSNSVVPQSLSPGPNILSPVLPVTTVASEQPAAIPSDETAPGVSESDQDQTLLSMLVRPPPPLSSVFSEQAKKLEKRNSCLATANAKDLYGIFYSSGGKGTPDTKLGGGALANGEGSSLSKTESSDTSSSTSLDSSVFQGELSQDKGLVTAVVSNSEKPISKPLVSTGQCSVMEHVDPDSRNTGSSFLQPLTRLFQNKPYETITPETDILATWSSSSFQRGTNRDRPPKGKSKSDRGKPGPPGTHPVPHLSDTHCHAMESQKLVKIDLIDSNDRDKESQELHQSEDWKESEVKNIEPNGKVAIEEGASASIGLHNMEDSDLNHGNRNMKGKVEQPKLLMIDTKVEQSRKLMTGFENPSKAVIEFRAQSFSSTKSKIDSFSSEARSMLQKPQDTPGKTPTTESLLQAPVRSSVCVTDSPPLKGVSAAGEDGVENSAPESASRTTTYRSLKLKSDGSKKFQDKVICELANWDENKKRPEAWESPKKLELETVEPRDISPERAVITEKKALGDFEAEQLEVKELAVLGDLHVDFCSTQREPAHSSPGALPQKGCEEKSVLLTPCDFQPVPSSSGFPLDSPKTLVLNLETEEKHNSSSPRSGRITSRCLKTGFPIENVERGLGGLEGAHQALDLLAGGMLPEEVTEASNLPKKESFRLEPETMSPSGIGPSPCLPDLVDFVTRTSGVPKEKPYSPLYEPDDLPHSSLEMRSLQLEIPNVSIPEEPIPQVNEDNGTPASGSPWREQGTGGDMAPQEMPEQEAAVDVIQNHVGPSADD